MQQYKTISGISSFTLTEKKSEFISVAGFVDTQKAATEFINEVKAKHKTAAHNVYAYILNNPIYEKFSDDGEPSKTAGMPTLDIIRHFGVVNCIIVTTRYFGGTLLGTGGLVRAYSQSAKGAIENAKVVSIEVCVNASVNVPYAQYEQALRILEQYGAKISEPIFEDTVKISFTVLESNINSVSEKLQELLKGSANLYISSPFNAPF